MQSANILEYLLKLEVRRCCAYALLMFSPWFSQFSQCPFIDPRLCCHNGTLARIAAATGSIASRGLMPRPCMALQGIRCWSKQHEIVSETSREIEGRQVPAVSFVDGDALDLTLWLCFLPHGQGFWNILNNTRKFLGELAHLRHIHGSSDLSRRDRLDTAANVWAEVLPPSTWTTQQG